MLWNRIFPFMISSAILGLLFSFLILFLAFKHMLIPEIVILGSAVLFVLWLTGVVGTAIQLYTSDANVNSNCENYVTKARFEGPSINTLAWITQFNICKFSFFSFFVYICI